MKLRLKNNSVRLRLTQSEVALLSDAGRVEETIEFGSEAHQRFIYALETITKTEFVSAAIENNRITIFVPEKQALDWIKSEQIGIKSEQEIGDGKILRVLIEKDFACLEPRTGDDDKDAFAHPLRDKIAKEKSSGTL